MADGDMIVHGSGAIQEVTKKIPHDQGAIRTMCRPGIFMEVVNQLSEEQKTVIRGMGFGTLLELKVKNICRKFIRKFCMHLSREENCFIFPDSGMRIPIAWQDVAHVMGVPSAGEMFAGVNVKVADRFQEWIYLVKHLKPKIGVDRKFKVIFIQFALATLLDPVSNYSGCKKTFNAVSQRVIESPKSYNWSKFMFDRLMNGIRTWQKSMYTKEAFVTGCLVFLQLFYVMKMHITSIPGIPHVERSVMWTDELLRIRLKMEYDTFSSYGHGTMQYFPYASQEPVPSPPILANPQVEIPCVIPETETPYNPMDMLSDEDIARLIKKKRSLLRKIGDEITELVEYALKKKAKCASCKAPAQGNQQTTNTNVEQDEAPEPASEMPRLPVANPFYPQQTKQTSDTDNVESETVEQACETVPDIQYCSPHAASVNPAENIPPSDIAISRITEPCSSHQNQLTTDTEVVKNVCVPVAPLLNDQPQPDVAKEDEIGSSVKNTHEAENDERVYKEVGVVNATDLQNQEDDDDVFVNPPPTNQSGLKAGKTSGKLAVGYPDDDDFVCPPPHASIDPAPVAAEISTETHTEADDDTVFVCPPIPNKAPSARRAKSKRKAVDPRRLKANKLKYVKS